LKTSPIKTLKGIGGNLNTPSASPGLFTCLFLEYEDGIDMFLRNAEPSWNYTELQNGRPYSADILLLKYNFSLCHEDLWGNKI
jgi:hypothetical protein